MSSKEEVIDIPAEIAKMSHEQLHGEFDHIKKRFPDPKWEGGLP